MKKILAVFLVVFVTLIALGLRLRAVELLPIDYDEDDYLSAGQRYAQFFRQGDWQSIIDYEFNYEHPPLTKIIYGLVILPLPEERLLPELSPNIPPASSLPQPHFEYGRLTAATFGALAALALAVLDPLGGFFLGIHTWTIKYTSQIMLEPLPALVSLLTVLCYARWKKGKLKRWLWLSAFFLGLTAASKYTYCIIGVAILVDWLYDEFSARGDQPEPAPAWRSLLLPLAWGVLAVAVFVAFDPRMWHDPLGRLAQSLLYHGDYAQSQHVQEAGFPSWQPLVWLAGPVPWHPGVFLFTIDFFITVLAIFGLRPMWQKQRVFVIWLAVGLGFLLLWPTKWPQYILTITAPLSLAAAEGFRLALWAPFSGWLRKIGAGLRRSPSLSLDGKAQSESAVQQREDVLQRRLGWRDARRAFPWLLLGTLALLVLAIFPLVYQFAMSLTDFNAISIRDGIQGGVWRAFWNGITGKEQPRQFDPFGYASRPNTVHYSGPFILLALLGGAIPEVLVFNIVWTVLSVTLITVLGVAVALLLNRRGVRFTNFWQAIFILPWAIPEFVGALIWLRVLQPGTGWLAISQQLPAGVNLSNWLDDPDRTLLYLLIAATWYGFPFIMLAATAGLKLIPEEVYDAAAIDGARGWGVFRYVTWPLLFPLLAPAVIIRSIFAFNQFYLFYTFRVNFNTATIATISYFIFSPTTMGQFAVSAAFNIFTVLILIVLIVWFSKVSKASEGVTYA